MKFVFYDKNEVETDIIVNLLNEEKIAHKTKKMFIHRHFLCEEDEDDEEFTIIEPIYDIYVFTDLAHFDFIKAVVEKRVANRKQLEEFYLLKSYKKKVRKNRVRQVSKKNITNTNNRNKT